MVLTEQWGQVNAPSDWSVFLRVLQAFLQGKLAFSSIVSQSGFYLNLSDYLVFCLCDSSYVYFHSKTKELQAEEGVKGRY